MLPPEASRGATSRAVRDRLAGLQGIVKGVAHLRGIGEIAEADSREYPQSFHRRSIAQARQRQAHRHGTLPGARLGMRRRQCRRCARALVLCLRADRSDMGAAGKPAVQSQASGGGSMSAIRFGSPEHFEMLEAKMAKLYSIEAAADRVCRFDWSGNDRDACAAMDALRAALCATGAQIMSGIPFTQYFRPYGRTEDRYIARPADIETAALRFMLCRRQLHRRDTTAHRRGQPCARQAGWRRVARCRADRLQNDEDVLAAVDQLVLLSRRAYREGSVR